MTLVECKDGSKEYVNNFEDMIYLVREKIGDDAAKLLKTEFCFDEIINTIWKIYEEHKDIYDDVWKHRAEFEDGNIHPEVAYMQMYETICNLL